MNTIGYEKGEEGDLIQSFSKLKPAVRQVLEEYFEDLPIDAPVDMGRVAQITNRAFGLKYRYGLGGLWVTIGVGLFILGYLSGSFFFYLFSILPLWGGYNIFLGKSLDLNVLTSVDFMSLKKLGLEPGRHGVERDRSLVLHEKSDTTNDSISDLFTGTISDYPTETFFYKRRYKDGVETAQVTRITFKTTFPHCVATNTILGNLPGRNAVKLPLLGNLAEKCSVYTTDAYKIEATQLFPPDMLELLFGEKGFFKKHGILTNYINIETVDHYLLITQPLGGSGNARNFVRAIADLLQKNGRDFAKFIDVQERGERYLLE